MFERMVDMIVNVISPGVMSDPTIAGCVDVGSLWVPLNVAVVANLLLWCLISIRRSRTLTLLSLRCRSGTNGWGRARCGCRTGVRSGTVSRHMAATDAGCGTGLRSTASILGGYRN